MINETEVLRISGNVTVPKGDEQTLKFIFNRMMNNRKYVWEGNIVPQDDESGMRLYVVAEVDMYKQWIKDLQAVIEKHKLTEIENDKLTLSLSEELAQEREKYNRLNYDFDQLQRYYHQEQDESLSRGRTIAELRLRLSAKAENKREELKEQTRWRTFTKWWKELWNN